MNTIEATEVITFISNLWPEWNPPEELETLWIKKFQKYDGGIIRQAAEEYRITQKGSYKSPKIHELLSMVKKAFLAAKPKGGDPEIAFTMRCVDHPVKHKIGMERDHYISITVGNSEQIATKETMPDLEVVKKIASDTIGRYKRTYFGEWAYVWGACFEGVQDDMPF